MTSAATKRVVTTLSPKQVITCIRLGQVVSITAVNDVPVFSSSELIVITWECLYQIIL